MKYAPEIKDAAHKLYLKQYEVPEIAQQLNVPTRTLYYWIQQGKWDAALKHEAPTNAIRRRITLLVSGEVPGDRNEQLGEIERLTGVLDNLQKQEERFIAAQAKAKAIGSGEASEQPSGGEGRSKKGKQRKQNQVSHLTADDFKEKFRGLLYDYQVKWLEAKENPLTRRIRDILKSRQTGATWYFSGEAFEDACLSGDNQIFLSASRAQAEIFRAYIVGFAREWFGIKLVGNPIVLDNGAELHFLSTNSATSQGYHGHVYVDEYFWIRDFNVLNKVASAVATHKKWRKTYFSTPSAKSHDAYPFWNMDTFNERMRKRNKPVVSFPSPKELSEGVKCGDGQWRNIVTIDDAVAGGCDLFDLAELELEYSEDEFNQLFRCMFIDDKKSVFKLKQLEKCLTDIHEQIKSFKPNSPRPWDDRPVWVGYDPSRTTDNATCVVLAPPSEQFPHFIVLEKHSWRGVNFQFQAKQIEAITKRYNVQHIGIDTTGIGYGVFDMVQAFYPRAQAIHYSVDVKIELVMKAISVIGAGRIIWDQSWSDIAAGFMTIRQTSTRGGTITYAAGRTEATGHADSAWAIMHALIKEPLNYENRRKSRYG
ncbi:terminase family protein [uncultured Amphritea sp.]|uniref:terminase large subunit domain-containing protein n=1 Tax=uncultured Amphritea sp. TaxID=981605 RepID=UPI0025ED32D7|nr:terminase family protein [uncultured Amphritea sp.]